MYIPLQSCFRKNLIVTHTTNEETLAKCYLIKEPVSGETFEFGEEEYFLCKSMDGTSTSSQILANFKGHFGLSLTEDNFNEFSEQIAGFGLLESFNHKVFSPSSVYLGNVQGFPQLSPSVTKAEQRKLEAKFKNQPKKIRKARPISGLFLILILCLIHLYLLLGHLEDFLSYWLGD